MSIFTQGWRGVLVVALILCMGQTCSPLKVCYSDLACVEDERCFKGDAETSVAEGICLAPGCEPACTAEETCVWDTLGWETHCVFIP
ncbi:MAG: hypothetical protein FWC28_07890 [Proteobacteria bacterium]|nr:hypothetical protein [Cystobacterineae bacterium]MCL2315152.1 hypothetical protein [Pseudomonadota bacterium]